MKPEAVAAAIIAGKSPMLDDMVEYWRLTDTGLRPKLETIAVLAALSASPATCSRVLGFVTYLRSAYRPIKLETSSLAVNIVGTGGGRSTFNISTTSAFVAAAAGATVLKSGSSAYSSTVGSGDILTALGLEKSISDNHLEDMLGNVGIGFASASSYAPICKRLAISALPLPFKMIGRFVNSLGPLICPYEIQANVVGASSEKLSEIINKVAAATGQSVLSVYSDQDVDEFLSIGTNHVIASENGRTYKVCGEKMGLMKGSFEALKGGDVSRNIQIMTDILRGKAAIIPMETVAMNAGAALFTSGITNSIGEGTKMALDCIKSGAPYEKLLQAQKFAVSDHKIMVNA